MMLRRELAQHLGAIAAAVGPESRLRGLLHSVRGTYPLGRPGSFGPASDIIGWLENPVQDGERIKVLRERAEHLKELLNTLSAQDSFRILHSAEQALENACVKLPEEVAYPDVIRLSLNNFGNALENYFRDRSWVTALEVHETARALDESLGLFDQLIRGMVVTLRGSQADTGVEGGRIELLFDGAMTGEELIEKLQALHDLYEVLSELVGVDVSSEPLGIQHLEFGSLWLTIFGETRVIELLDTYIRAAAGFIHRRTSEGRRSAMVPSGVEDLNKIVQFLPKLEKAGVDTSEIKEEIRRGAYQVAKNLNALLASEGAIEVNGERFNTSTSPRRLSRRADLRLLPPADERE
jgi:hypothetical protein